MILSEKIKEEKGDDFEKELSMIGKSEEEKKADEEIEKIKKKMLGDR